MASAIPQNRASFTLDELVRATGGEVRPGRAREVCGVTSDSRGDVSGKLFVALVGERFDGHDYAAQAAASGAACVLLSRDVELPEGVTAIRVADTLDALGALARFHRRRWAGQLVAVAGSAGKTTTKSAIARLLTALAPGAVHAVPGNLNNRVGVPFVVFGIEPAHRVAVVELGTNQRGELAALCSVAEPDIGVLTLIALEHSEGLGDIDGVEAEEGALFASLGPASTAIANADDERCRRQLSNCRAGHKLAYGASADADYRLLARRQLGPERAELQLRRPSAEPAELRVRSGLLGLPGALATLAALAVAERLALPVGAADLERALGEPPPEGGRLVPIALKDGSLLIDDSYNANPASVKSSVEVAREFSTSNNARLLLVIGEMRELGECSEREHRLLGDALAESGAALLIGVAGDARYLIEPAAARGIHAEFQPAAEDALSLLLEYARAGDVVLVKGSRGVGLERVVNGVVEARGRAA